MNGYNRSSPFLLLPAVNRCRFGSLEPKGSYYYCVFNDNEPCGIIAIETFHAEEELRRMATSDNGISESTFLVTPSWPMAESPFDDMAADVVFKTADGVDFHVYKIILALASPFFADMFSLQNRQTSPTDNAFCEPIVIQERSQIFDCLLRFCYPLDHPTISTLPFLESVLEAAIKYQIPKIVNVLRESLITYITSSPSQVLGIACRLHLEKEAVAAANGPQCSKPKCKCKKLGGTIHHGASKEYLPEMGDISAGVLYRLRHHRRNSHKRSTHIIEPGDPANDHTRTKYIYACDVTGAPLQLNLKDADVILRSLDGTEFPSNRLLIRISSADRILGLAQVENESIDGSVLPVVCVGLTSDILTDLLRMCHPAGHYELDDPYRLWKLSQVAIKYDMPCIIEALKNQMMRLISTRPFAICLAAMQNGWLEEAKAAAHVLAQRREIEIYEPILEDIPAALFNLLLQYHSCCVAAATELMQEHAPESTVWMELWKGSQTLHYQFLLASFVERESVSTSSKTVSTSTWRNRALQPHPLSPVKTKEPLQISELIKSADTLQDAIQKALEEKMLDWVETLKKFHEIPSPTGQTSTTET